MTIFKTTDVFGNEVILKESTMKKHIATETNHSEMAGNEIAIKRSIEDPEVVYRSKTHPETRKLFFSRRPESTYPFLYTSVVVEYKQGSGYVTTALFKKEIQGVSQEGLIYVKRHS